MANGSRHSMTLTRENNGYGNYLMAPFTLAPIRHTGTTLGLSKEALQSEEIRNDRQIADFRHGAYQVGGDINFELSFSTFDEIMEAVLMGEWTPQTTTGIQTMAHEGAGGRVIWPTGDFAPFFPVGTYVEIEGYSNASNNGLFLVTYHSVSPGAGPAIQTMGVTNFNTNAPPAVAEAANPNVRISAYDAEVKAGTTRRSFVVERFFGDLATIDKPYHTFSGVEFNTLSLAISANAMVTGTCGVLGQSLELNTTQLGAGGGGGGGVLLPATITSPLDSFSGMLYERGTGIAVVTEIQLNIENGLEARFVVGSKATISPSVGRSNVSGTMTAYFEDSSLLDKFINETETSLMIVLSDAAGNNYGIILPRIKFSGGQPDVEGEGPITLSMPFQALLDDVDGTNIKILRVKVPV